MRLKEGDNHLISERDGLAVVQVWLRPDLSNEHGAQNAREMTAFIEEVVLRPGTKYRGVIFDVRRGPTTFGPNTRESLTGLVKRSAAQKVKVAIVCGESATQVLQFRSLCTRSPSMAQVFDNEAAALQWLRAVPPAAPAGPPPGARR